MKHFNGGASYKSLGTSDQGLPSDILSPLKLSIQICAYIAWFPCVLHDQLVSSVLILSAFSSLRHKANKGPV
jgi:hypothetical protein